MNTKTRRIKNLPAVALVVVGMLGFSRGACAQDEAVAEKVGRAMKISSLTDGMLQKIGPMRPGDLVKQGDVLAEVDPAEYQILLRMARAKIDVVKSDIDAATASLEMAEAHRAMIQKLEVAAAEEELRRADFMVRSAEAERRKKQAELAIAESESMLMELYLERTRILAPYDGTVESVEVQMGELVSKGKLLFTFRRAE